MAEARQLPRVVIVDAVGAALAVGVEIAGGDEDANVLALNTDVLLTEP